jgi:hypothetical protein
MSIDNFDKDNLEIKDLLEEKEFVYKDEKT